MRLYCVSDGVNSRTKMYKYGTFAPSVIVLHAKFSSPLHHQNLHCLRHDILNNTLEITPYSSTTLALNTAQTFILAASDHKL